MAFNLEEWSKLSEAECERRYRQRLRDEERGKTSPKSSRSFSLSSSSLPFSESGLVSSHAFIARVSRAPKRISGDCVNIPPPLAYPSGLDCVGPIRITA
jgi:hypothetical protein